MDPRRGTTSVAKMTRSEEMETIVSIVQSVAVAAVEVLVPAVAVEGTKKAIEEEEEEEREMTMAE